jgi:hypothetical protein
LINIYAVIISIIIYWLLGALWFSKKGFGKIWSKALGKNLDELGPDIKQAIGSFLTNAVVIFILAFLLDLIVPHNLFASFLVSLLIGVGFIFTADLYDVIFEQKSFIAFLIDIGYHMVGIIIAGLILGTWQ